MPVLTGTGKTLDLAKQPGWRVIYFWSAECPCVAACENFTFRPLAKQYAGKVSFYAVVSGGYDLSQSSSEIARDVAKHHLPYPVVLDIQHKAALALGAQVTPETFVIDSQDHVVFAGMPDDYSWFLKRKGGEALASTYLAQALQQALSGVKVKHPTNELQGCVVAW